MKSSVHGICEENSKSLEQNLTYDYSLHKVNPFFFKKPLEIPEIKYQNGDLIDFS